jgi:hypothetical protein
VLFFALTSVGTQRVAAWKQIVVGWTINCRTLDQLPERAILIKPARGAILDEDAQVEAMQSGKTFAAGLDVFQTEPGGHAKFAAPPNDFLLPLSGWPLKRRTMLPGSEHWIIWAHSLLDRPRRTGWHKAGATICAQKVVINTYQRLLSGQSALT